MSAPLVNTLKVSYLGTNVGKIYLSDLQKRLGLGGAQEGDWYGGQDEYIVWGEKKVLLLTGDVITSMTNGIIAHFSNPTNTEWNTLNGAPLSLDVGLHTVYENLPSILFMTGTLLGPAGGATGIWGGTGLDYAWSDQYLSQLAIDQWGPAVNGPTGTWAGQTGWYYGNAI
jgi:hypothetical protein